MVDNLPMMKMDPPTKMMSQLLRIIFCLLKVKRLTPFLKSWLVYFSLERMVSVQERLEPEVLGLATMKINFINPMLINRRKKFQKKEFQRKESLKMLLELRKNLKSLKTQENLEKKEQVLKIQEHQAKKTKRRKTKSKKNKKTKITL